ncbi:glycosyltransferase family 2 protein [Paenibacillus graminis]|uniref:Glycosyltransferase n=1 Tax=Paenibacillus graminis TaxID=189425 RepID=A0A089MBM5_9BACL|nr:glycosyltransferase family A protein [Paenibacillus graminis]AIQ70697.1 glycosyltransferase [Paenibacillus graminis]
MTEKIGKVSVVIPMYNSEATIVRTLNSIMEQTFIEYIEEIIIVNDGSEDNSSRIVKEYRRDHLNLPIILIDKENSGVSAARNTGMRISKGKWIALLDSDDEWLPHKLEIQINTLLKNPEIDFLGGDIDNKGLKILWRQINGLYKAKISDVCLKMFPQTSVAIFKRVIFEQIGGYDENQKYAEDGNYFLKICANYNYYHLPLQLVSFGGGKPQFGYSGLSGNLEKMYEGNIKNIKELKNDNYISVNFYVFLRFFYYAKYIRRILITKIHRRSYRHDDLKQVQE